MQTEVTPNVIGTTGYWMRRMAVPGISAESMESAVARCAEWVGAPIIGAWAVRQSTLTLMKWPDERPGYINPEVYQCDSVFYELRDDLNAKELPVLFSKGQIHTMMGLRRDGYTNNDYADISDVKALAPHMKLQPVRMVSARPVADKNTEIYGEQAVVIVGHEKYEKEIHTVGRQLKQHHYAIERPEHGRTNFYQTIN